MSKSASIVMNKAVSFLGTKETPAGSNNVKFNTDYYGKEVSGDSYPWCCAFVWDCFRLAGASDLFYDGKKTAYCPTVESWGKQKKLTIDKTKGKYGDIVLFDFSNKGIAGHIGFIVGKNADGSYQTLEGNTSVTSNDNGGCVMYRTRHTSVIRCIIRPEYAAETSTVVKTTKSKEYKPSATITSESSKKDIKWLQTKLNLLLSGARKANLTNGKLDEDGIYGQQTSNAVFYYWKQLNWAIQGKGKDGYYHAGTKTINALAEGKK